MIVRALTLDLQHLPHDMRTIRVRGRDWVIRHKIGSPNVASKTPIPKRIGVFLCLYGEVIFYEGSFELPVENSYMKKCNKCGGRIPSKIKVDGVVKVLSSRRFCLECSPFGLHNTKDITQPASPKTKKERDAEKFRAWQQKAREERKLKLVEMLGGKCEKCDYDKCKRCLHFHHRNPQNKKFAIGTHGLCRRWDDLVAEAMKCMLLCPTCHCEHHQDEGH